VIGIVRRMTVEAEGEKRMGKGGINRVEKGRGRKK
jgi:hypothetical protein